MSTRVQSKAAASVRWKTTLARGCRPPEQNHSGMPDALTREGGRVHGHAGPVKTDYDHAAIAQGH